MENIFYPTIGGVIIGLAATFMLISSGKITGISGIIGGALSRIQKDHYWRYAFLLGLLFGGGVMLLTAPHLFNYSFEFSFFEIIVSGLLVGVGTRLGSGCTSGHGVCGLPRLSARSLMATLIFMGVAVATVYLRGLAG